MGPGSGTVILAVAVMLKVWNIPTHSMNNFSKIGNGLRDMVRSRLF